MRVVTDRSSFAATAADAPPDARVPVELRVRVADPFEAYRRARRGDGGDVYLETTGGQSGWGYFATDPVERVTVGADAEPIDEGGSPSLSHDSPSSSFDGSEGSPRSPSLATLDAILENETLERGDCDVPYPCGAFGWLSYDVARELEDIPETTTDDRGLPRLQLATYDRVAAWAEPWTGEATLRVTACPRLSDHDAVDDAYECGVGHARDLVARAVAGDRSVGRAPAEARRATFDAGCTRAEFADRVRRVKAAIRDGDTFQANVSQRLSAPAAVHPVDAYAALRRVNPAPYSALLEFPGVDLVSASPELLLDVDGDRLLTEPIAGTRPRGETREEDEALAADLRSDEKERAEHAMLVDLERNDLGKVSEYGSVDVREYRRVDRYSEVMHLVSLVEGRRREGCSVAGAVAAVFPGGTITGAPKPRTMAIIDAVERTRRGPYTGAVGVFGFDDRATLNIVIRTLVRTGERYDLRVGAGIVHDSDPDSEYDETLDKGRALVNAIDAALDRETFALEAD
ncbi:aminodeoxychorismate synthase, component I [Natronomonas salina]|uniref:aminodeoxychorismate synthase, component I n=1 Tax=Natronomonas salina TaxID=1710540 RepID=UPI0015B3B6A5|nr:aminodeoxychorismate synthase, component I [Natronomonas salina]QLD88666.1 aminodeoxychorismate synthase, component I [Natronomonas salina]